MADVPNICIAGSLNMDLVVRTARFPRPGETVLGRSFTTYPGGKGANQAVAAARLGARVSLLGVRGADPHGDALQRALEEEGIETAGVGVRDDTPTGVASIVVNGDGLNTIVVSPGANATFSAADVERHAARITSADALLLQLEVPLDTVAKAARVARGAGVTVLLNAAPARPLPEELMADTDVLLLNHTEALSLCGRADDVDVDLGELAEILLDLGPGMLVLTLGGEGSVLYRADAGPLVQRAFLVETVDTTAAGDAFTGGFAVEWCNSHDPERALRLGAAAGALACSRAGAQPSLPRASEVERLLARSGRARLKA